MNLNIARPTRDRPHYILSKTLSIYKSQPVEIEDELAAEISETYLKFQNHQGILAKLYHEKDKELLPL